MVFFSQIKLGIQTYQNLTDDDEVCIPSFSSILLAVEILESQSLALNSNFWAAQNNHYTKQDLGYYDLYFLNFLPVLLKMLVPVDTVIKIGILCYLLICTSSSLLKSFIADLNSEKGIVTWNKVEVEFTIFHCFTSTGAQNSRNYQICVSFLDAPILFTLSYFTKLYLLSSKNLLKLLYYLLLTNLF